MTPAEEALYEEGHRAAWVQLLRTAVRELGHDSPDANAARWIIQREEVVAALRRLCRDFGDNDWPDNLSLADVINKHLGRYLYAAAEETTS